MRVYLRPSNTHLWIALAAAFAVSTAMTGYFAMYSQRPWVGAAFALIGSGLCLYCVFSMQSAAILVMDEDGICDPRLGVGIIPWSDVIHVQIVSMYGNRFLCFQVCQPETYVRRLTEDRQRKARYNHELGFRRINLDLSASDLSLIDIKRQIDQRIGITRAPIAR